MREAIMERRRDGIRERVSFVGKRNAGPDEIRKNISEVHPASARRAIAIDAHIDRSGGDIGVTGPSPCATPVAVNDVMHSDRRRAVYGDCHGCYLAEPHQSLNKHFPVESV
jgi:hypothetical protein